MADGRIYVLQPSFASGEISPDVASRVDLGKYQNALLQAENVFIRPYGSAYRRPGTMACDSIGDDNVRLQEFAAPMGVTSFLLVFLGRGAGEIATDFGLNHAFGDILTGIILFFIIGCEFFINYKISLTKTEKKEEK